MAANRQIKRIGGGRRIPSCTTSEDLHIKEALIEKSLSATLVSDLAGYITYVNRAFLQLWGYDSPDEIIGRRLVDLLLGDGVEQTWCEQVRRSSPWSGEHIAVRKNGSLRVVQHSAYAITGAGGCPLCFASYFRDITEHAQVEQSLRASERRYRNIVDAVPVGIALTDGRGVVTYYSAQMRTLFNLADDQCGLGTNYRDWVVLGQLETLPPPDYGDPGNTHLVELRLLRADGTEFWGEAAAVLLDAEDDGLDEMQLGGTGSIIVVREISDRKRAEESLACYAQELERSNQELEQFAYVASHDLQEPLRMVAAYVQLLAKDYEGRLSPEADEYIDFAVDGARRMQWLIDDLLTYSRVGTRGHVFEPVVCNDVMAEVLASLRLAIEESEATVRSVPLPTVYGDRGQIYQLLQNLIGNALKFRGATQPSIQISARHVGNEGSTRRTAGDSGFWQFNVSDNGIGIESQYWERIFVIFQRLHNRAQYCGTGIGLAICKKIVERHGGRIWVESTPGTGSTFYFTLPDAPPPHRELAPEYHGRMQQYIEQ